MGGSCKTFPFRKCQRRLQYVVMLFRVAGAALCDIPTCLITCRKSFCVAGAILLRRFHKMSCSFRGKRSILDIFRRDALRALHSTLRILHSTLHPLHFTLQTLHFTLHTLHSTLYTLHSTLYTPHSTLHTLHFTLHTIHSTLYTLHSTLHTVHTTLPTLHFTLHT